MRTSKPYKPTKPTYTRRFALWPQRMTSGRRLWLCHYYITPDHNGHGRLINEQEYQEETKNVVS